MLRTLSIILLNVAESSMAQQTHVIRVWILAECVTWILSLNSDVLQSTIESTSITYVYDELTSTSGTQLNSAILASDLLSLFIRY